MQALCHAQCGTKVKHNSRLPKKHNWEKRGVFVNGVYVSLHAI